MAPAPVLVLVPVLVVCMATMEVAAHMGMVLAAAAIGLLAATMVVQELLGLMVEAMAMEGALVMVQDTVLVLVGQCMAAVDMAAGMDMADRADMVDRTVVVMVVVVVVVVVTVVAGDMGIDTTPMVDEVSQSSCQSPFL